MTRIIHLVLLASLVFLAGCAGTIQRDSAHGLASIEGATFKSVDVVMTEKAKALLADNPQFNAQDLGGAVQRRLEAAKLIRADAKHRVEITIESFNIRSMVTAVVLSFVAGPDTIEGRVRVFDDTGLQLHAYKVSASYSFGGVAGGLDPVRMGFLYDKFSELTIDELAGKTDASNVALPPKP